MDSVEWGIIEAPSVLGLSPHGTEQGPAALVELGLVEALSGVHRGRVDPLPYNPARDSVTKLLNPKALGTYAIALANRLDGVIEENYRPVVLGGDCSILMGIMLCLRRRGRYGLLFLDGHQDFYEPAASPTGQAADMDLAIVTGHGHPDVDNLEGLGPLVDEQNVAMVGNRDDDEVAAAGAQRIDETAITHIPLDVLRAGGIDETVADVMDRFDSALDGIWIHLDVDVLDDAVMPAVDYRMPGGMRPDELISVLNHAVGSGRIVGLNVTIYNPKLDRDRRCGRLIVDCLRRGLVPDEA